MSQLLDCFRDGRFRILGVLRRFWDDSGEVLGRLWGDSGRVLGRMLERVLWRVLGGWGAGEGV